MMMIFKCWEWLRILIDDSLPSTPKTPSPLPELCDDVLIDILLRVRPEVLARFKCVNKQAHRLINDPDFLLRYRSQLPNHPYPLLGLFYQSQPRNQIGFANLKIQNRPSQPVDNSLSFLPNPVRILATRYGLILSITIQLNPVRYYVCNPVTKQRTLLPDFKGPYEKYSTGFFVDPKFGHYRVVRIPGLAARNTFAFVETFSSQTGKWRLLKLKLSSPYCLFSPNWPAVQWNGSLHWVDALGSILSFDVKNEKFGILDLPHLEDPRNMCKYKRVVIRFGALGVSGGFLTYSYSDIYSIYVWVRVCDNWVLARKVSMGVVMSNNLEVLRNLGNSGGLIGGGLVIFRPVGFDEFNPRVVFLSVHGWVVSYQFEEMRIEPVRDQSEEVEGLFPYVTPQLPFGVEFHGMDTSRSNF